jgi:neprosin-like protein
VPEETSPAASDSPMNEDGHVLKSRRGLLAAGLAVAVVGALGVASTMNAGAEEIPGTQDTTSAAATTDPATEAAADPAATPDADPIAAPPVAVQPPTVLPWGARPQRISRGRAGASASSLRAAGLDAAPADTSGSTVPTAEFAPKGAAEAEVPPQPPMTETPVSDGKVKAKFYYATGTQLAESDGIYANVTISKPKLGANDYHSLGELAAQNFPSFDNPDVHQTVEVGWNVDRGVNGDDDPHLFVYHWVDGKKSCYNACGFVQYSTSVKPGDTLTYDVAKKFGIQYTGGAWWIAYDSEWVGYFPEKLWNDEGVRFSRTNFVQAFGEVAGSLTSAPCTEMGNGKSPDLLPTNTAARFAAVSYVNGPPVALIVDPDDLLPQQYQAVQATTRTFRYGGATAANC